MAKELTGTTKLSQKAEKVDLNLVKKTKKILPTSFRLRPSDQEKLKVMFKNVNDLSEQNISMTKLMYGIIDIASNVAPDRLLKAVKESYFS